MTFICIPFVKILCVTCKAYVPTGFRSNMIIAISICAVAWLTCCFSSNEYTINNGSSTKVLKQLAHLINIGFFLLNLLNLQRDSSCLESVGVTNQNTPRRMISEYTYSAIYVFVLHQFLYNRFLHLAKLTAKVIITLEIGSSLVLSLQVATEYCSKRLFQIIATKLFLSVSVMVQIYDIWYYSIT